MGHHATGQFSNLTIGRPEKTAGSRQRAAGGKPSEAEIGRLEDETCAAANREAPSVFGDAQREANNDDVRTGVRLSLSRYAIGQT